MTERQFIDESFGTNGAIYESGTTAVTGTFCAITALEATVFSLLTVENWGGDTTANLPLPAGATLFGRVSAFTLSSGKVIAYKRAA